MSDNKFQKGYKYEIFIGIKDKDSYQEILNVESFKKILVEVCTEKQISFSSGLMRRAALISFLQDACSLLFTLSSFVATTRGI